MKSVSEVIDEWFDNERTGWKSFTSTEEMKADLKSQLADFVPKNVGISDFNKIYDDAWENGYQEAKDDFLKMIGDFQNDIFNHWVFVDTDIEQLGHDLEEWFNKIKQKLSEGEKK